MKKWTADDIPDQEGNVVIITGANSGLGYESSLALAKKGARVIMACWNLEKGLIAKEKVLKDHPAALLDLQPLDLASLASIKDFSQYIHKAYDQIHLLINNAGIMATPFGHTEDGFEWQFGTNHLGHFALTGLLLDRILLASGSRIVTVSSIAARRGRIHFDDLMSEKEYVPWEAYGQSKLANQLFAYELQRRLEANALKTSSMAAHPGVSMTNLHRAMELNSTLVKVGEKLFGWILQNAAKGALPQLYAATDPAAKPGGYYGPDGFREMSGYPSEADVPSRARDLDAAEKLWRVSEELTGAVYEY